MGILLPLVIQFKRILQSSTVFTVAKEKLHHNLLLKWTEHTVKNNIHAPTLLHFQQWLEIQAKVLEAVDPNFTRPNKPIVPKLRSSSPSPIRKRNRTNVFCVNFTTRSLAVRGISNLPSKIEYSMLKLCISVSTASVKAI